MQIVKAKQIVATKDQHACNNFRNICLVSQLFTHISYFHADLYSKYYKN